MKERPILFSGPMVRALLDGSKTQTRRVIKPGPQKIITDVSGKTSNDPPDESDVTVQFLSEAWCGPQWYVWLTEYPEEGAHPIGHCPYGAPGDQLWVRETFAQDDGIIRYRADEADDQRPWANPYANWCPSIFMPRWASRIQIEIADVRVERVQDISMYDAMDEGVETTPALFEKGSHLVGAFAALWDSINGARPGCSWAANPWVWCLTFKRLTP